MTKQHVRKFLHILVLALALTLGTGTSLNAVYAAEESQNKATQEQLDQLAKASPEDREKVRNIAVEKYTEAFCVQILDQAIAFPGQDKKQICTDEIGQNVDTLIDTPEKGINGEIDLQQVCGPGGANVSNFGLKNACIVKGLADKLYSQLPKVITGLISNPTVAGIVRTGVAVAEVAEFIKDPKDPFEMLANHVHKEAVNWTVKVMDIATKSTDFDPTQTWFRTSWAGGAGVGLLLMGFMFLLTLKDLGAGKIDEDEMRSSMLQWGPIAVIVATFGPSLMGQLTSVMSAMNSGIITARGDDLTGRILDFLQDLATMESASTGFGPILMILVFIVMIIASLMLFIIFLLQQFALIMLAYGIAIMLGSLINPRWRSGLLKAGTTWITVLFSKPILLIMMSLIFTIDFASIAPDDGLQLLSQTILVILAIGAVAFSPMILLKYVPMVSSPGSLATPSGPSLDSYSGGGSNGGSSGTSHMNNMVTRANEKSSTNTETTSDSVQQSSGNGSTNTSPSSGSGSSVQAPPAVASSPEKSSSSDSGTSEANTSATSEGSTENATSSSPEAGNITSSGPSTGSTSADSSTGTNFNGAQGSSGTDAGEDFGTVQPVNGTNDSSDAAVNGSPSGSLPSSASSQSSGASGTGTSSTAASGAQASKASGASGASAGAGVAGGVFAGTLIAAAAAKKAADTGKDSLVGLNQEAANFQDYNSDQQPGGR